MAKHILLAEDSVTMQKVVAMTLAGEDVTLSVTATVDDALASARSRRPDLVIADLSLQGKNGYDLAAAIKAEDGAIPVVLLHGSAVPLDSARAMRSGADGELVKPFETQALIEKLWSLMEGSDAVSMPGPVEPLGEPLSAATRAPAGAGAAAAGVHRAPPAARAAAGARPLGAVSTAPGTGAGAVPPPAVPAPRPPIAVPRPPVALPRQPAAAAAPSRPPVAVPAAPRPRPMPPLAAAAGLSSEPTALEITIEAELPPPVLAEPLPSFDVALTTELGRNVARELGGGDAAAPPRPTRTLAGWGEGLPTPPPGMPLPRGAALPGVAAAPAPGATAGGGQDLDPAAYAAIVKLSREVIERVAWEIVPELAETIIREQLDRVLAQRAK
ncbi:MAG: response regulator [Proteobacteria bacterium]|nr:response regulator [Pseudomonadota bacterium]